MLLIQKKKITTIMGKIGRTIIKQDVEKLIDELNRALSEEWLAYYQYWIGARVVKGPMRSTVESELKKHAREELEHADKLADRIIQLGGTPVIDPQEWSRLSGCKYYPPVEHCVKEILKQNLASERCAIKRYQEITDMTYGKDHVTFRIAEEILEDELEHENDIEAWLEDMNMPECK